MGWLQDMGGDVVTTEQQLKTDLGEILGATGWFTSWHSVGESLLKGCNNCGIQIGLSGCWLLVVAECIQSGRGPELLSGCKRLCVTPAFIYYCVCAWLCVSSIAVMCPCAAAAGLPPPALALNCIGGSSAAAIAKVLRCAGGGCLRGDKEAG